ncbi:hypothetical protein [Actinophytocola oryzae]|uniref:HTH luxR-type domain-containing protein n=1 Tax=Actinophytocola oryzae TaxID=502181 RepID=A0A4R7UNM0_9PSEU|nr:hypothetical protein [Actinophytocola oryzae]TDV34591.1 hypothetical protein CLV71_1386 [Actinophytocola oryzae]
MTSGPAPDTARNAAVLDQIVPSVVAGTAPPLVVLAGPAGAGRSTVLDQVGEGLRARGVRTRTIRCSPPPFASPLHTMLKPVLRADVAALLIDDVQWLDQRSLEALEVLVRTARAAGLTCVCTAGPPAPAQGRAALRRLREEGLATVLGLRPLGMADVAALTTRAFQARPDRRLVARLRHRTAGNQAALHGALAEYGRTGAIRVLAGGAFLDATEGEPDLPEQHQLVTAVRRLGADVWRVAKATAVLHPLGAALPELAGTAVTTDLAVVRHALDMLVDREVLRRTRHGWRFRVEMVASAIVAQLGPYERRHLAGTAITALWNGTAACDDPAYRADQLAGAGKLVDTRRSCAELLAHADTASAAPGSRHWLRAAANLVADPVERAVLLARYAFACFRHGAYADSVATATALLDDHADHLRDDARDELSHLLVLATHGIGDTHPETPDPAPHEVIGAATALLALDRPDDCLTLLRRAGTSHVRHLVEAQAHLYRGDRARFDAAVGAAARQAAGRVEIAQLRLLPALVAGDADDAEKGLIAESVPADRLAIPYQAVLLLQRNRFSHGAELAHQAVASGAVAGADPACTVVYQWLAHAVLARGDLASARALLVAARTARAALPHLLDATEAVIDIALGNLEQARTRLRDGLSTAALAGVVLGTDQLLVQLAEVEFLLGNTAGARSCSAEATRIAEKAGGVGVGHLVAQAVVAHDGALASSATRLAVERGQPLELAAAVGRLASHGLAPDEAVADAYELLDDLDALLYRAWLRNVMRERNIRVPGRARTVVENERLLAGLVADGLSNRELATVLAASEKSVEGRLGRLFTRTGYQSRVALATAVHSGEYQPEGGLGR